MNLDLEALKAAALAAVPGEWWAEGDMVKCRIVVESAPDHPKITLWKPPAVGGAISQEQLNATASHIAAANPAAVLALIERVELAEQDNRALLGAMHRQTRLLDHAIEEHAANAMLIEENDRLQRKLETQTKPDRFSGLPLRPIIPEAVMRRCERPYAGPVKPGDVFAWEPDIDTARELLVVTRITKEPGFIEPYEERVFTRPIDGGKEVWNDMEGFREAVVPTLFRPWPVEDEVRP